MIAKPANMQATIVPYADGMVDGVRDLILPIQQKEFGIPITYDELADLHDIEGF